MDDEFENYRGHIVIKQPTGSSITIPCPYRYSQIWKINDDIYSLSGLPPAVNLHYVGLELPKAAAIHDQMEFQCYTSNGSDVKTIASSPPVFIHIFNGII